MRLSCQKLFILAVMLTACHEPTALLPRVYVLESITGQPLPAIKYAIGSDTGRVVQSTITFDSFDATGNALFSDSLSTVHLGSPPVAQTITYTEGYRITGENVTFSCVGPLDCATLPVGVISGSTLTLSGGGLNPAAILLYRLAQTH